MSNLPETRKEIEERIEKITSARKLNHSFRDDFQYKTTNPYNAKLKEFDHFVLMDTVAEQYLGRWNKNLFKNDLPLHMEIGSGYGDFMVEYCQNNPEVNFVGMDYRFKRSFTLSTRLENLKSQNFRYLRAKGERLGFLFGENEIEKLFYFFPDPWPRARQHKNRLFQEPFLIDIYKVLQAGGKLYLKTDHTEYFTWMKIVLEKYQERFSDKMFEIELQTSDLHSDYPEHFLTDYKTKFEKIFLSKDKKIKAMILHKPSIR